MNRVEFIDLGVTGYLAAWEIQRELAGEALSRRASGQEALHRVLCVEHPRVYTLGKNGNERNLLVAGEVPLVRVDRGGDITYHGPGQLVVYPVVDLLAIGMGVREYVEMLEEVVIEVLRRYEIAGERLAGATGVWIEPRGESARKICAIGIKCSRHVTMHGLALNVNTELKWFSRIVPCGLAGKGVTSMARELGEEVSMETTREMMQEELEVRLRSRPGKQASKARYQPGKAHDQESQARDQPSSAGDRASSTGDRASSAGDQASSAGDQVSQAQYQA